MVAIENSSFVAIDWNMEVANSSKSEFDNWSCSISNLIDYNDLPKVEQLPVHNFE